MVDPVYLADGQSLLNLPIYSSALKSNLQVGQLGKFELNQAPVSVSRYKPAVYLSIHDKYETRRPAHPRASK